MGMQSCLAVGEEEKKQEATEALSLGDTYQSRFNPPSIVSLGSPKGQ
jgi:hypothetical protein